jgi:hypothetical protein
MGKERKKRTKKEETEKGTKKEWRNRGRSTGV